MQDLNNFRQYDEVIRKEQDQPTLDRMMMLLEKQEFYELEDTAKVELQRMVVCDRQFALTTKARKYMDEVIRLGNRSNEEKLLLRQINTHLCEELIQR